MSAPTSAQPGPRRHRLPLSPGFPLPRLRSGLRCRRGRLASFVGQLPVRILPLALSAALLLGCGKKQEAIHPQPSPYESQGYASPFPPSPAHKKQLLSAISTGQQQFDIRFDETVLAEAMSWYDRGDIEVLPFILDAGKHSDGAASELLGAFLFEKTIKQPATFLRAVSRRPVSDQKRLAELAVSGDGSGQPSEDVEKFKASLNQLAQSPDKAISQSARLWLAEVNSFQKQSQP